MDQRVQETLQKIVDQFTQGDIPDVVAIALFPSVDVPCSHYSLMNRMLVGISGTSDARGYKAWKAVGRQVKAGSKAVWILAPSMISKTATDPLTGQEKKTQILVGFHAIPVFRLEDTEGEPVVYQTFEPPEPPELIEVAQELNVKVSYVAGNMLRNAYGRYSLLHDDIVLASPEEAVFFHELSHAAHNRLEHLHGGQDPYQEIAAELSAIALGRLFGKKINGRSYQYIQHYAEEAGKTPAEACLKIIGTVEKILGLILQTKEKAAKVAA